MPQINPQYPASTGSWYQPQQPTMHPPNTDYYRGGAAGVQNDFGLQQMFASGALNNYNNNANNQFTANMNFANTKNQALMQAGGLVTQGQVNTARGDLMPTYQRFQGLADNGKYTGAEYNSILGDRYNQAQMAKAGIQKNLNAQLSSMGLGLNPGLTSSMGFAGEFAAAGQRGEALAGLDREQADSRVTGMQGMGQIAQQLAAIGVMPTQENMMAMISQMQKAEAPQGSSAGVMDLYNQWRNAAVGPGAGLGANHPASPTAPSYSPIMYPPNQPTHGGSITW